MIDVREGVAAPVTIDNVVAGFHCGNTRPLDLYEFMMRGLPFAAELDGKNALRIQFDSPTHLRLGQPTVSAGGRVAVRRVGRVTMTIFRSGNVNMTGGVSVPLTRLTALRLVQQLRAHGMHRIGMTNFRASNYVCGVSMCRTPNLSAPRGVFLVDLDAFAAAYGTGHVTYDPAKFGAVIYSLAPAPPERPTKRSFSIFRSGEIIMAGARSVTDAYRMRDFIVELVLPFRDLQRLDAITAPEYQRARAREKTLGLRAALAQMQPGGVSLGAMLGPPKNTSNDPVATRVADSGGGGGAGLGITGADV